MSKKILPYHFVPNHRQGDILESLVSHVPGPGNENLYSGEMRVELTFLTPFFCGAGRYAKKGGRFQPKEREDTKEHTYLAPLTYPEMTFSKDGKEAVLPQDAQFVIPPTTLKGLYGDLIDKITAAPMKRVTDPSSGIQFRFLQSPQEVKAGILFQNGERWEIFPADPNAPIVFNNDRPKGSVIRSLGDIRSENYLSPKTVCFRHKKIPGAYKVEKSGAYFLPATLGRINGAGNWVEVAYQYKGWAKKYGSENNHRRQLYGTVFLCLDHISSAGDLCPVSSSVIEIYKKTWSREENEKYVALKNGMAIFFLADSHGEVVAISPNFRMKWPFLDGLHYTDTNHRIQDGSRKRGQVGYLPGEALAPNGTIEETRLTPRQRMFGYTFQADCMQQGKQESDYLAAYAGRVHFNMAVHQGESGRRSTDEWMLPILGQPQASSYEHYLLPDKEGKVTDYGLPHLARTETSRLAGRKHYLHQPANQFKKVKDGSGQNCTLLAHLRPVLGNDTEPFPVFRFTVRFTRLADWEVGLLHRVLNLSGTVDLPLLKNAIKTQVTHAQALKHMAVRGVKLGYARPLGWGSALSQVKGIRLTSRLGSLPRDADAKDFLEALDRKVDRWFQEGKGKPFWQKTYALRALDMLCRFRWPDFSTERDDFDYPRGGEKNEIFAFHMNFKKGHIANRLNRKAGMDSPLPPVEEVWSKPYKISGPATHGPGTRHHPNKKK